jgi:Ca2+-binding EF-hand superfamily protein
MSLKKLFYTSLTSLILFSSGCNHNYGALKETAEEFQMEREINRVMREFDLDKDGMISRQELKDYFEHKERRKNK